MCKDGEFSDEGGNQKGPHGMIDILAIGLEGGVYFLSTKVHGITPIDIPILHEEDVGILAMVAWLPLTIIPTAVYHQENVAEVEGVGDGVLVEEDLLLVFAQLLTDPVEINNAVIDWFLVTVVLTDSKTFRDGLETLLEVAHLEVDICHWKDAVIDFVTADEAHFWFLLEEIAEAAIEVAMHSSHTLHNATLYASEQWLEVTGFGGMVVVGELLDLLAESREIERVGVVL